MKARPSGHSAGLIPATLDLAERAALALNAMTEATDPEEDYRVYWKVTFRSNPPIMYHDFSDTGIAAKFMEGIPRMRLMSGSSQGAHVEERWRELLPERIAPDGLVETRLDDRLSPSRQSSALGVSDGQSIVDMQVNGLMLGAVTTYAVLEGRESWEVARPSHLRSRGQAARDRNVRPGVRSTMTGSQGEPESTSPLTIAVGGEYISERLPSRTKEVCLPHQLMRNVMKWRVGWGIPDGSVHELF